MKETENMSSCSGPNGDVGEVALFTDAGKALLDELAELRKRPTEDK